MNSNSHGIGLIVALQNRYGLKDQSLPNPLKIIDFSHTIFDTPVSFKRFIFPNTADFESATFSRLAYFKSATFSAQINFINSEFTSKTIFANANFNNVPDFRGAKMHEATEWHGIAWPSVPIDKENAQDQVYKYERLKQEMERLKKHEDEQFFFRKELRVRRKLMPLWSVARFLNYLYEALSDYGQSTNKPLLWLCGSFLLGGAGFAWSFNNAGTSWTILHAASLSFASIFPFFPFYKETINPDVFASLSSLAKIIVVMASFFGTLLLFLLGLALRNRFRMR